MQVIAHRGASATHRENSIAAFAAAVEVGADGVELDVWPTVDGRLAVHHDHHLANGQAVTSLSSTDLPRGVPMLDEAVEVCGATHVNVEIKVDRARRSAEGDVATAERVLAVMAGRQAGGFSVSSFDLATVDAVVRMAPGVTTAHLFDRGDPAGCLRRAAQAGHRAVHPHDLMVDEVFMAMAADLGLTVNVWTVDDPGRLVELWRLGVDGVITNDPRRTIDVLAGHR